MIVSKRDYASIKTKYERIVLKNIINESKMVISNAKSIETNRILIDRIDIDKENVQFGYNLENVIETIFGCCQELKAIDMEDTLRKIPEDEEEGYYDAFYAKLIARVVIWGDYVHYVNGTIVIEIDKGRLHELSLTTKIASELAIEFNNSIAMSKLDDHICTANTGE